MQCGMLTGIVHLVVKNMKAADNDIEVDGYEELKLSSSPRHRDSSPLLQSPPSSDDETPTDAHGGRTHLSSSECTGRLELVGCAACGECFESAEALVEHHEHRCVGLLSETEGEDESTSFVLPPRTYFACPKCPELNFKGRCELIRHLKGHRQRSLNKSRYSSSSVDAILVKKICVCRRRPCRCPPRSLKKVHPITARKVSEAAHNASAAVLCHICFAGKLSLDKEAKINDLKDGSPDGIQCTVCLSEPQRHHNSSP
ncbi:hypothetical protein BIW11_11145 [Tropilaelaps mercedesae]|uniref:Uncharacterized protein n=1 Tax=Tropilaelaps mercedesae TaxID=418985 RepID=A0A1V9XCX8_9ACAR|nr:hypothetical protein BIW11_11145 [Tropilaelaps mercedesae]